MDCENVFKQEMLVSKGRGTKLEEWMDVTETEEIILTRFRERNKTMKIRS